MFVTDKKSTRIKIEHYKKYHEKYGRKIMLEYEKRTPSEEVGEELNVSEKQTNVTRWKYENILGID